MRIPVTEQIDLTEFRETDIADLVQHLADREIYETTLRIPHPYLEVHAREWLAIVDKATRQAGHPVHFAIREGDRLIGSCGFEQPPVSVHRAEIGYWLARGWWGRGIMTNAVSALCRHGFEDLGFEKLTAHVFDFNQASARVLEKCGFKQEGHLRNHYRKEGELIDARVYGRLRGE